MGLGFGVGVRVRVGVGVRVRVRVRVSMARVRAWVRQSVRHLRVGHDVAERAVAVAARQEGAMHREEGER